MKKIFNKALEHRGGLRGITTDFCSASGFPNKSISRIEEHKEIKKKAEEKVEQEAIKNAK